MNTNIFRRALAGIAAWLLCASAFAAPFSKLIIFSGSLSDTGNHAAANGPLPAPYWQNRSTDGPVAVEVFASKFRLNTDPSLHVIGRQGGTNYGTLHAAAAGNTVIDLPYQIQSYLNPRGGVADKDALYFIFIGAHDIIGATIEQNERQSEQMLRNGIAAVDDAFRKLHAAGGRTFYAPNNVNLGIAPVTRDFNVSARATEKTRTFNRLWEMKLRQLERELDITIYRFDFYRFAGDLLASGDKLGFTDITHSCLALMSQGRCNLDRFAFLNELLPTKRIHDLLGNALALALIEQMDAAQCTLRHRCGRKAKGQSYSEIYLQDN